MVENKSKDFHVLVKSTGDEPGGFEGILSTYGNVDEVGDICEKGCFDTSLAKAGSKRTLLWQHDWNQPIGSFEAWSDESALRVKGRINLDVERGREAYALLKAEDIDGLSIGYTLEKYDYDKDGIRHLLEVDLLEGSLVTFPANKLARARAKSLQRKARIMDLARLKSVQMLDEDTRKALLKELAEALDDEDEEKQDPAEEESEAVTEEPAEGEEEKAEEEPEGDDQPEDDSDLIAEIERLKEGLRALEERIS